jgi:hypothetical protein
MVTRKRAADSVVIDIDDKKIKMSPKIWIATLAVLVLAAVLLFTASFSWERGKGFSCGNDPVNLKDLKK